MFRFMFILPAKLSGQEQLPCILGASWGECSRSHSGESVEMPLEEYCHKQLSSTDQAQVLAGPPENLAAKTGSLMKLQSALESLCCQLQHIHVEEQQQHNFTSPFWFGVSS